MTGPFSEILRREPDVPLRRCWGWWMLLLLPCAPNVLAQDHEDYFPLGVKIDESSHLSRTCGPVRLQMEFDWNGPGFLEGALAIDLSDSEGQLLGQFVIDGLYLPQGKQRQDIMLPGFRVHTMMGELQLRLTLLDADGKPRGELEPQTLRISGESPRSLLIATCRPELDREDRQQNDLADLLHLEEFAPEYDVGRAMKPLLTRSVFLPAEELPNEPLRLCTYDLVLLSGAALSRAGTKELDALLAWVWAGGGLCLTIDESRMKTAQVEFMNALAGTPADNPVFLPNSDGQLVYGNAETPSAPLRFQPGLGRVVVLGWNDALRDPGAEHWSSTSAFLWRVRREHLDSIRQTGRWDLEKSLDSVRRAFKDNGVEYTQLEETARSLASDMKPIPVSGGAAVVKKLLPEGMKMIPLSLIAVVLAVYVAVIGPLDYVVLGKFRLRRFTWLTFPALTFGFTVFALMLSNNYMKTADHRARITFRDLGPGGVVLRENRLELLFPSTSRQIPTELGRGLFMPLRYEDFGQDMISMYAYGPYGYQQREDTRAAPPRITGRMPSRCRADQWVPQWTPQLNRMLTIPLEARPDPEFQFDWDQRPDFRNRGADGLLAQRIREAFGTRASAYLYHMTDVRRITGGSEELLSSDSWEQVITRGGYLPRRSNFLREVCVPNQPGFLSVASELAPTGGDRFDDMSLLDPTDERQWVLVIGASAAEGLVIYRRRYYLDD